MSEYTCPVCGEEVSVMGHGPQPRPGKLSPKATELGVKSFPAVRPFCFVASPFAAEYRRDASVNDIAMDIARNIVFAEAICRRVALETSLIPFAPHLLFPRFLRDHEAAERDLGISYAKRILPLCSLAVFAVPPWRSNFSTGMKFEEALAVSLYVPMAVTFGRASDWLLGGIATRFPPAK